MKKLLLIVLTMSLAFLTGCVSSGEKIRIDTRGNGSLGFKIGDFSYQKSGDYSRAEMGDYRSPSGVVSISNDTVRWENRSFDIRF